MQMCFFKQTCSQFLQIQYRNFMDKGCISKVRYGVHMNQPLAPNPSKMNPVYNFTSYFLECNGF
jgi:hypothetical protein